jgi:hypothetical protein
MSWKCSGLKPSPGVAGGGSWAGLRGGRGGGGAHGPAPGSGQAGGQVAVEFLERAHARGRRPGRAVRSRRRCRRAPASRRCPGSPRSRCRRRWCPARRRSRSARRARCRSTLSIQIGRRRLGASSAPIVTASERLQPGLLFAQPAEGDGALLDLARPMARITGHLADRMFAHLVVDLFVADVGLGADAGLAQTRRPPRARSHRPPTRSRRRRPDAGPARTAACRHVLDQDADEPLERLQGRRGAA